MRAGREVRAAVTGAGGFIGGHLVRRLLEEGYEVRAVDRKPLVEWWQIHRDAENLAENQLVDNVDAVVAGVNDVYHLAEDMGGIGHIENNRFDCSVSIVPSVSVLRAATNRGVERFFFASSACVYNTQRQDETDVAPLKESDAFPSLPEAGYGETKLFFEQVLRYAEMEGRIKARIARFHNVYGPHGSWQGGREKAPAALCRKIAMAKLGAASTEIEVWGDGQQTRSFMYVDDCVEGTVRIAAGGYPHPLNLGSDQLIAIDDLAYLIAEIAGVDITIRHQPDAPKGVRGRNSDNTLIRQQLGWEPSISLRDGLTNTYQWIEQQVSSRLCAAQIGKEQP